MDLAKYRKIEDQIIYKNLESKFQKNIKVPILPSEKPKDPLPNDFPKTYPDEHLWVWELYEELSESLEKAI